MRARWGRRHPQPGSGARKIGSAMIAALTIVTVPAPVSAGKAQATMSVSALVLGMGEVDTQIESLAAHSWEPGRVCAAVVVHCTASGPVRVTIEDQRGSRRSIASLCPSSASASQPVRSCVAPLAKGGLRISIEY